MRPRGLESFWERTGKRSEDNHHMLGMLRTRPEDWSDITEIGAQMAPKCPRDGPRWPQNGSKKVPNEAKMAPSWLTQWPGWPKKLQHGPRWPQERPREPQGGPRGPQEGPERAPRGPKRSPRRLQEGPRGPQDAPKRAHVDAKMTQHRGRYPKLRPRRPNVKNVEKPIENNGFWRVRGFRRGLRWLQDRLKLG